MTPSRLLARQSLAGLMRDRSVLILVAFFAAMVMVTAWLGWKGGIHRACCYTDGGFVSRSCDRIAQLWPTSADCNRSDATHCVSMHVNTSQLRLRSRMKKNLQTTLLH